LTARTRSPGGLWPGDAFEEYGAVRRHDGGWVADLERKGDGEGAGGLKYPYPTKEFAASDIGCLGL
jgi:hypothetical protein